MSRYAIYKARRDEAELASFYSSRTWIPLMEKFSRSGRLVLVKMLDGAVALGRWNTDRGEWEHTSAAWGTPAYWAVLPSML